jgi:hypothetical protein
MAAVMYDEQLIGEGFKITKLTLTNPRQAAFGYFGRNPTSAPQWFERFYEACEAALKDAEWEASEQSFGNDILDSHHSPSPEIQAMGRANVKILKDAIALSISGGITPSASWTW